MLPSDKGDNPTRRVKTLKGRRRQGLLRTETMPRDRDHYGQAFLLILSAAIPKHQGGGVSNSSNNTSPQWVGAADVQWLH